MALDIEALLGADKSLLSHVCKGIPKETLHLPGPGSNPGVGNGKCSFVDTQLTESGRWRQQTK